MRTLYRQWRQKVLRASSRTIARHLLHWPRHTVATVSFTFDDAPASAALEGANLLEASGMRGTYYVATSLLGTQTEVGRILSEKTLTALHTAGHEIGCHTFSHQPADLGPPWRFSADMDRNRAFLECIIPKLDLRSFAFPFGAVAPLAKRAAARRYASCRTTSSGIITSQFDAALLSANSLYSSRTPLRTVFRLLDRAVEQEGWVIFVCHDVASEPSEWGCTPRYLSEVISAVRQRNMIVRTVGSTIAALTQPHDGNIP